MLATLGARRTPDIAAKQASSFTHAVSDGLQDAILGNSHLPVQKVSSNHYPHRHELSLEVGGQQVRSNEPRTKGSRKTKRKIYANLHSWSSEPGIKCTDDERQDVLAFLPLPNTGDGGETYVQSTEVRLIDTSYGLPTSKRHHHPGSSPSERRKKKEIRLSHPPPWYLRLERIYLISALALSAFFVRPKIQSSRSACYTGGLLIAHYMSAAGSAAVESVVAHSPGGPPSMAAHDKFLLEEEEYE